jgi:Lipocalin-like domain
VYGADGEMSIEVMKHPHPKVASGDEENVTPKEKQALFDSYMAYFGTYSVEQGRGVVIHHVEDDLWSVGWQG